MNYTFNEIKKIQKNIKEDFEENGMSFKNNILLENVSEFYKEKDKNRKKATQEKIKQIPYFHELVAIFGKEATYKAIAQTSLSESKGSTQLLKKILIIEKCIKQRIPFLNYIKIKVILMGQDIENCIVYLYVDDKNYLISKVSSLINNDWEEIETSTKSYYNNMQLLAKAEKILNNPISQLLSLQVKLA